MRVFRKLFDKKLSDPEFKRYYYKSCAICPITVRIVTAITESPESMDEIAVSCDISAQDIADLETAENCCVASVRKLCDYFNIPGPVDCRQFRDIDRDIGD